MSGQGSVALVHDYLLVMRGAERAFAAIADCWSDAPIYTLLYDVDGTDRRFAHRDVTPSYLQRLGIRQKGFRRLLPLFPRAVERLPLQEYDLVISSSSAFAHGVRTRRDAVHVCYCYTPFRYAWHEQARALEEAPAPLRPLLRRTLERIRTWDRAAAQRVTRYVAISQLARRRIAEFWGREATVVHPPVEVERFRVGRPEDYFLIVTELVRHKRVELALEAAARAGVAVKVVGTGPDLRRLADRYGAATSFLGRVPDDELTDLYSRARALIVPNVEEFGIAAVEAQAAGRPVVAAAEGGALETVLDGETGVLVPPGDLRALERALRDTDFDRFDSKHLARHARAFSPEAFAEGLRRAVDEALRGGAPAQGSAAPSSAST